MTQQQGNAASRAQAATTAQPSTDRAITSYVERLERSYFTFRWTLSLLEPEECNRPCLANGWTPIATVAHIAWWDDFQRRRMEAALRRDCARQIPWPTESNDERAANESRAWKTVLAEADGARAQLIEFALSLTREQIEADYEIVERASARERRGEDATRPLVRQLLTRMPQHVEEHTAELRRYCISLARWGRDGFLRFYRRQFDNFLSAITGLTEETCVSIPVCGDWSVRDLLAHTLVWDEYAWEVIRRWPDLDLPALAPWTDADADTINARLLAAKADMSMIDLLDGLATFHRRIIRRYRRLNDEQIQAETEYGWGEQTNLIGFLYYMSVHTADHAAEIYAARAEGRLVPLT